MARSQGDEGMTLLELTMVMAIFSLLAVMALQLLSAALHNRTRITAASVAVADVVAVTSLLRRDLATAVPVSDDDSRAFDATRESLSFAIADRDGLQRVTWQLEERRLRRASRPWLETGDTPASVMLEDVDDLQLRLMTDSGRWIDAASWQGPEPWALPAALDVRFDTAELPDLRVLVAR